MAHLSPAHHTFAGWAGPFIPGGEHHCPGVPVSMLGQLGPTWVGVLEFCKTEGRWLLTSFRCGSQRLSPSPHAHAELRREFLQDGAEPQPGTGRWH